MQNTIKRRAGGGFAALLKSSPKWFAAWAAVGAAIRVLFVLHFPMVTPDSLVYGDFAKNWLERGIYGLTQAEGVVPSVIRLPGYPAFLAFWFRLAGLDHYGSALWAQAAVDMATCFVIAAMGCRISGFRAAKWSFALAVVCPFLANYTAAALTETLAIFFTALALLFAMQGADELDAGRLGSWLCCGLATGAGILLRPDGGMVLIAIGGWLLWRLVTGRNKAHVFRAGLVLIVVSLAPLVPWTVRNAITFHRFEPLPPVTATEPGEFFPHGFMRWLRTWMTDYASMEDVAFHVDGEEIPPQNIPPRAYDNFDEQRRTLDLLSAYNEKQVMTPELDAAFAQLAHDRIHRHPLRYYIWLPIVRGFDMWLRPRTEMIPVDPHWWDWNDPHDAALSWGMAALNLALVGAAICVVIGRYPLRHLGILLVFVAVRTVLITAISLPEQRYTLECLPVVLALAAVLAEPRAAIRTAEKRMDSAPAHA